MVTSCVWYCGCGGLRLLTLKRRRAANHIDNLPKPLLDRRGFGLLLEGRKAKGCCRSEGVTEPSKTAFLRPRRAANHTDNHPKSLLSWRGFLFTFVSAEGRVCCLSAGVSALPVTVFLRSGRIGWFIGKSDFFCTHCDRLSSFVVSLFAGFYRISGFSVGCGRFRCCGRIYSFGQRILIFVRCQY